MSQRFGAETGGWVSRKRVFRQKENKYKIPVVRMGLTCSENSPEAIVPWSTMIGGRGQSGQSPNLVHYGKYPGFWCPILLLRIIISDNLNL